MQYSALRVADSVWFSQSEMIQYTVFRVSWFSVVFSEWADLAYCSKLADSAWFSQSDLIDNGVLRESWSSTANNFIMVFSEWADWECYSQRKLISVWCSQRELIQSGVFRVELIQSGVFRVSWCSVVFSGWADSVPRSQKELTQHGILNIVSTEFSEWADSV